MANSRSKRQVKQTHSADCGGEQEEGRSCTDADGRIWSAVRSVNTAATSRSSIRPSQLFIYRRPRVLRRSNVKLDTASSKWDQTSHPRFRILHFLSGDWKKMKNSEARWILLTIEGNGKTFVGDLFIIHLMLVHFKKWSKARACTKQVWILQRHHKKLNQVKEIRHQFWRRIFRVRHDFGLIHNQSEGGLPLRLLL